MRTEDVYILNEWEGIALAIPVYSEPRKGWVIRRLAERPISNLSKNQK
jgi:hypothetical protein